MPPMCRNWSTRWPVLAFRGDPGFNPRTLSPLLVRLASQPELGAIWVADAGVSSWATSSRCTVFSLEQQGLSAEIDEFFVSPAARTYGVGAALLDVAESDLAQTDVCACSFSSGRAIRAPARSIGGTVYREREGYELLDKRLAQ